MIDPTFATVIIGFILLLFTVLWSDRKHDKRFDKQDEKFDRQDERLRAIETELVEVKVELKAQSERLDRHDQHFDQQDQRFDRVDERFDRQSAEINVVGRKIDRVEGMVYVLIHGPEYRGRGITPELEPEEEMSEPVGN